MPNIKEWGKGISFFLFVTLLFYFLWNNIFSNIIEFVGTDIFSIGESASIAILKTTAWTSFLMIYLGISGVYLIYSIIAGSQGNVKTEPIEFLKAIGIWSILMPIFSFIFGLIYKLQEGLISGTTGLMDATSFTTANTFTWIIALIGLAGLTGIPFIYIIKGYGINITGENNEN